jgi:cytochrome c2
MKRAVSTATILGLLAGGWVLAQKKPDPAKGKQAFEQCAVCHASTTDEKKMGPSLKGLFKRAKLHNGKPVNDQTVLDVIKKGGNGMPAFDELLSAQEKANVLAFLKTL